MTNRSYALGAVGLLFLSAILVAGRKAVDAAGTVDPPLAAAFPHVGKPLALVVLRLRDCGAKIEGLRQLNRLVDEGEVDVRGVVLDADRSSRPLGEILAGSGIKFPVSRDPTSRAAEQLSSLSGYRTTPLLFLFDREGELRSVTGLATGASLWSSARLDTILATVRKPNARIGSDPRVTQP